MKGNVEGYSEMSDEAFARRFYSDRAELLALGVPLDSQRDEFTGEELYTLRSERYFLGELELTDDELAALQTAFFLLEGRFAYAEPLRLALQNLALGRPGLERPPSGAADRVQIREVDYSPETPGRLAKLEGAISKQRTVKFNYHAISRNEEHERTIDPYALLLDGGRWYVIGRDHDRDANRTFRVSRIRGEIRLATRRERDFRLPEDFDVEAHRGRAHWQIGDPAGEARIEVAGDTAWWVERVYGRAGRIEDGVFVTQYASLEPLVRWILRQDGRAVPVSPPALRREVKAALELARERHEADRRRSRRRRSRRIWSRSSGPAPRRAGAVRTAPVAARLPARPLRREHEHGHPGRRAERALPHCARGARGAPVAPEPRELRRRLLRGVRRAAR